MQWGINITKLSYFLTVTINNLFVVLFTIPFQMFVYFITKLIIAFLNIIFCVFIICSIIMKVYCGEMTNVKKGRTEEIYNIRVAKFSIQFHTHP